jgi:hypothetical protein
MEIAAAAVLELQYVASRFEEIDLLERRRSLRKRCGGGNARGPTADDRDFPVLTDELLIEDGINQI